MTSSQLFSGDLKTILDGYLLANLLPDGYSPTLYTDGYSIQFQRAILVQLVVSNGTSPIGTLDVEGSLDGVNYFSMTNGVPKAFSGDGSTALNFDSIAVKWIRAKVIRTSGTGTMKILYSLI